MAISMSVCLMDGSRDSVPWERYTNTTVAKSTNFIKREFFKSLHPRSECMTLN